MCVISRRTNAPLVISRGIGARQKPPCEHVPRCLVAATPSGREVAADEAALRRHGVTQVCALLNCYNYYYYNYNYNNNNYYNYNYNNDYYYFFIFIYF